MFYCQHRFSSNLKPFERIIISPDVSRITFEVSEGEIDGGYSASALGYRINTQADTHDELRHNIREAVDCYFDEASANRLS